MSEYGFKTITADNWLEVDPIHHLIVVSNHDGSLRPQAVADRLTLILEPQLNATGPLDVRRHYEVARGAMVYGNLFYPLYALGATHLLRVAEAAITEKVTAVGGTNTRLTLKAKINWLEQQGLVAPEAAQRWHLIRTGCNLVSHPTQQSLFSALQAPALLRGITEEINALFADQSAREP